MAIGRQDYLQDIVRARRYFLREATCRCKRCIVSVVYDINTARRGNTNMRSLVTAKMRRLYCLMEPFEELFKRTYDKVTRMANSVTHNKSDASDVVQSAAMYVLEAKPEGVTESYWCQLVMNRAKDVLRLRHKRKEVPSGTTVRDIAGIEADVLKRIIKRR